MSLGEDARKHRILLIDDASPERSLFAEILNDQGYVTDESDNASGALEQIVANPPDLILLDMHMRTPDGSELPRQIRECKAAADIPIIFVSAGNSREDRINAFSAGGVDYLCKPVEPQEALARIANHLSFRELRCNLEKRVKERTAELEAANFRLIREISGRRSAEDDLTQHNALINSLIDANIIGIMFVRSDGKLLDANTAFLELFSLNKEDVLSGKVQWQEMVAEENADSTRAAIEQIAETGRCLPYEKICIDAHGKRIPILIGSARLPDSGTCIAFVLDLTERKQIEQRLREVLARNATNIEAERKRIAREIHDEQGSLLTAIKLELSLLHRELGDLPEKQANRISHLLQLTDETVRVMRHIATQLRPAALNLGLLPSLEWLVTDLQRRTGIESVFLAPEDVEVEEALAATLFRVVQESLTNVVRHASATKVEIAISLSEKLLRLTIKDNGEGFSSARKSNTSLGLQGISERIEILGGAFGIESAPGKGTTLVISLPLDRCDK